MTAYSVVGKPVTRQEGPDKVSGHFQYAADVAWPGRSGGNGRRRLPSYQPGTWMERSAGCNACLSFVRIVLLSSSVEIAQQIASGSALGKGYLPG